MTINIKQGLQQYKQTVKEIIITATVMIIAWIILGILNYLGIKSKFLIPLNFLTGTLNGMQGGGAIGIIGGIVAKFLLILMIVQTLIPIYKENFGKNKEKKDIKQLYNKIIDLFKTVISHGLKLLGFLLIGVGIALIIYAFLTVNGNFENSFVIILALLSTIRILLSQSSTVIRFFTTMLRLEHISNLPVYSLFLGLSIGFTLSLSIAVIFKSAILAYIIGFIINIVGFLIIRKKYVHNS